MLILFDHRTPAGLARALPAHTVVRVQARGWDRRIRYQQNLSQRRIAIVVLAGSTKWSRIRLHLQEISTAVNAASPASYTEVQIPFD